MQNLSISLPVNLNMEQTNTKKLRSCDYPSHTSLLPESHSYQGLRSEESEVTQVPYLNFFFYHKLPSVNEICRLGPFGRARSNSGSLLLPNYSQIPFNTVLYTMFGSTNTTDNRER